MPDLSSSPIGACDLSWLPSIYSLPYHHLDHVTERARDALYPFPSVPRYLLLVFPSISHTGSVEQTARHQAGHAGDLVDVFCDPHPSVCHLESGGLKLFPWSWFRQEESLECCNVERGDFCRKKREGGGDKIVAYQSPPLRFSAHCATSLQKIPA
jgi:hypothetical protein